jgi:predicted GH43/DUF377 family glycosyl hydrolase
MNLFYIKRLSLFFLFIFLAIGCLSINAKKSDLEPDFDNPLVGTKLDKCGIVLPRGALGTWDSGMVEGPSIWFDPNKQQYGMVYVGYQWDTPPKMSYKAVSMPQIGIAWSSDLVHWTKDSRNPVLKASHVAGSTDEYGASAPAMWYENGKYYLFYFGVTGKGYEKGTKTLNVATSTDLVTWQRYAGNPIIKPVETSDPQNSWRSQAIWRPNVLKKGNTYYLFFNASGVVNGKEEERIGYATSSDLLHWTVDDANAPIVSGSGISGAWDASGRAGDPSVYKIGRFWFMSWYGWERDMVLHRGKRVDMLSTRDGLAWTTEAEFPLNWRQYPKNPVLDIGAKNSFDGLHAAKSFIQLANNKHYHFYAAVDTSQSRNIALAMSPRCTE